MGYCIQRLGGWGMSGLGREEGRAAWLSNQNETKAETNHLRKGRVVRALHCNAHTRSRVMATALASSADTETPCPFTSCGFVYVWCAVNRPYFAPINTHTSTPHPSPSCLTTATIPFIHTHTDEHIHTLYSASNLSVTMVRDTRKMGTSSVRSMFLATACLRCSREKECVCVRERVCVCVCVICRLSCLYVCLIVSSASHPSASVALPT